MLRDLKTPDDERLLVGIATGDDAGVFWLDSERALVQTLDFFTPVVDDPFTFGQIAAANALSDVYAMGGRPLTVMNILCWPIADRDINELAAILKGGADKVTESGAALVGGHSVEDAEPKFGLSVTGEVHPDHIATNAGAKAGDIIVLTKPLGTGIVTTAAKFDDCSSETLAAAVASMSSLNASGAQAMREVGIGADGVHAATDITGFGLLGHLLQMAKASGITIEIETNALPLLPDIEALIASGNTTKGGVNNAEFVAPMTVYGPNVPDYLRHLVVDPQTSGGLAICVETNRLDELLRSLKANGSISSSVIGRIVAGKPGLRVL